MKNLLLFRLAIFNTCAAALVVWAYFLGYVNLILDADPTKITHVISGLFVVGLASLFWRAHKTGRALDALKAKYMWYAGEKSLMARQARKMAIKNEHLGDIPEYLVLLGLIGNAVGFLMSFGGIDMSTLGSADGLMQAGTQILAGIGTAFGSTVAGCILAMLAMMNFRMLATATALYNEDVA